MLRFSFLLLLITILLSCQTSKNELSSKEQTIYLVRHAEKADDGTKDPPLSDIGMKTGSKLATQLKNKNISRIFSSDYKRTRMTATFLSEKIDVPIEIYDPRDLPAFSQKLKTIEGDHILVIGHSNTTPSLANLIIGKSTFQQYEESEYSNLIIITKKEGNYTADMISIVK